jgi:hypothetical protein
VLAVPFLLLAHLFSLPRYIGILKMAIHEGFAFADLLRCVKWAGLLMALVVVSDRWQQPAEQLSREERRFRFRYRASILLGFALASVPGAAYTAGPRHLLPFIPWCSGMSHRVSAGLKRRLADATALSGGCSHILPRPHA